MIDLTRLNGHRLLLNPDLIKYAEPTPDLVLTLITGEKIIVGGTCETLIERITEYRATVLGQAWPDAAQALNALPSTALSSTALPFKEQL